MLLTLSLPTLWPEDIVRQAATTIGAYARIKWARPANPPHLPAECRFKLVAAPQSFMPASSGQHDLFIAALFQADPAAIVRTSRAIYEGAKDFEAQLRARVDS